MYRLSLILGICTMLLVSCGEKKETVKSQADSSAVRPLPINFELKTFDKENLKGKFEIKGLIINGSHWVDRNGDNYVVLSESSKERTQEDLYLKSKYLYAVHYADFNTGTYSEVKKIVDQVRDCEYNNIAAFIPSTLSATDLDKDGFAEITFMYKLGCKSELSPDELKLIMMENGEKYAIRGESIVMMGEQEIGGKKNIDKAFNNAPQSFLDFANDLWKRNLRQPEEQQ